MVHEKLHLKDYFSVLGENGADPTLEIYLPYNMTEMGWQDRKRPCMVVCPGGGYSMCSQREAEPIALHFLPEGFNVFILKYTCAPAKFPTQLREVEAVMELIRMRMLGTAIHLRFQLSVSLRVVILRRITAQCSTARK